LVGPIEPGMRNLMAGEPLSNVEISGSLRGDALREAFAGADIFCLPSIEEGFALAILEAMAAGLPVVATEETGCAEAIDNGVEGLVVAARDPAAITDALASLIDDPDRGRGMGKAARARAARDFGWDRYGARALAIYNRVLGAT
jgi:glycosyltransferase involved in cell wall biosynthesis